jgi:hypothetical protein
VTSYNFLYPQLVIFSPKLLQLLISDSLLSSLPNSYSFLYPTACYLLSQTPTASYIRQLVIFSPKLLHPINIPAPFHYIYELLSCVSFIKSYNQTKKKHHPKALKSGLLPTLSHSLMLYFHVALWQAAIKKFSHYGVFFYFSLISRFLR